MAKFIKKATYNTLVAFDLSGEDNKNGLRGSIEDYLKEALEWVWLQETVWLVTSSRNAEEIFEELRSNFQDSESKIFTIDISNRGFHYKEFIDQGTGTI